MNTKKNISDLQDFFKEKSQRQLNTSYETVINTYNNDIHNFLLKYYGATIKCGIIIEDKIINPTNEHIAYMNNAIGSDFMLQQSFISSKLQKWIPTLTLAQTNTLSESMYSVLCDLQKSGKNDSALKNAYTKFMCWLYYKFRSVLNQLSNDNIPKILYEGTITSYELFMLEVLVRYGCDVVILDYGTQDKVKSERMFPEVFVIQNGEPFPNNCIIKTLKEETLQLQKMNNILGSKSVYRLCRNAWMNDTKIEEVTREDRSDDVNFICSSFLKFTGTEDRNTYVNDLYKIYNTIKTQSRQILILESGIPAISPSEINALKRTNCNTVSDVIIFMTQNVRLNDSELTKYAKYVFCDYIKSMNDLPLNKLEETISKLLALFNRYKDLLSIKKPGCMFILEKEALKESDYRFFELFSQFPVDVVIINPAKIIDNITSSVLEFSYDNTLEINKFPTERIEASYSTTAYNAENDLTSMLYQNTGLYRDRQYKKAESVILKTMYEEIEILWNEDISLRQGFSTDDDKVIIPAIFAKVCGVKDGNKKAYIKSIEKLVTDNENVLYIKNHFPYSFSVQDNQNGFASGFHGRVHNPVLGYAMSSMIGNTSGRTMAVNMASVMSNGKIDIEKIKQHECFKYNYLRDETIFFMVDKLQRMLESRIVDGIGTNGNENILLNIFFNLPKDILTMIQKFDFTKINPKIVYVNSGEDILTLEDTILIQYLSFLGFDIVMFIPTGYNTVEKYFNKKLFTEYQIGEYMYDLPVDIKKKKSFFGL